MKTVAELARDAIMALNAVPAENVGIDEVVRENWNGVTRIVVSEGETIPDECQLGLLSQTTPLTISCFTNDRQEAQNICRQIAQAVYRAMENLEHKKGSGILAITRGSSSVTNTSDCRGFIASRTFNVVNRINF